MIAWINEFAGRWAEYFGWAVVQHTIFLGIILLVLKILRNTPAAFRFWIGMIVWSSWSYRRF
jgi:hypothetical protein